MRSRTLLVLAGVALGVGGTLFVTGPSLPSAAAQNPGGRAVGTYQIAAYGAGPGSGHGAYVLDTTSGEVFWVSGANKPTTVGAVPRGK